MIDEHTDKCHGLTFLTIYPTNIYIHYDGCGFKISLDDHSKMAYI
jgi:hypothetical protein